MRAVPFHDRDLTIFDRYAVTYAVMYAGGHLTGVTGELLDKCDTIVSDWSGDCCILPYQAMSSTFVTVSQAQDLTGKSERTIRRFLTANVNDHPEYCEMETKSGRKVWLISTEYLSEHYPFQNAGDTDTLTSRDSAGKDATGGRNLQKEWQESKRNLPDNLEKLDGGVSNDSSSDHDKPHDTPESPDTAELWKLIHTQQEEIKRKDEQLDRYFTGQQEMMKTLGRLMEQDNLLLARSQEATLGNSEAIVKPEPANEVEVVEVKRERVAAKAKKGSGSAKNSNMKSTKNTKASRTKAKTSDQTQTNRWWGLFRT
ncbi:MAG: hypothetical protein AAF483_19925 [Planctomycetota bacterium]